MILWSALAMAAPVLSVAPFEVNGDPELRPLAKGLSAMVITDVCGHAPVTCVERGRLNAILDELELSQSAFVDPATAQKIGRVVGASHTVLGTLTSSEGQVRLDARLVRVKNGKVLVSVSKTGPSDQVFELEQALTAALITELGGTPPTVETAPTTAAITAYGRALDAEDSGRIGLATLLLDRAAAAHPTLVWARERGDILREKLGRASQSQSVKAELIAYLDGIERGDTPACTGFQTRFWTLGQPLNLGGRFLMIGDESVLDRYQQIRLEERPEDLAAMAEALGRQLYDAHAVVRLTLDREIDDSVCPGANPNETVLSGIVMSLGAARESAGKPVEMVMIAPDGSIEYDGNGLDGLLLDYAEAYVTRFPTGGLLTTLHFWVEPALERTQ